MMNLSDSAKKSIFIFGSALVLFMLLRKGKRSMGEGSMNFSGGADAVPDPAQRDKVVIPTMSKSEAGKNRKSKDAYVALKAYMTAYNSGESKSALDELNRELSKELGVKVYRKASDGRFIVCDLTGKEILSNA